VRLLIINARVVSPAGEGALRGRAMNHLDIVPTADVFVEGEQIVSIDPAPSGLRDEFDNSIDIVDAMGRVLMPAFVDAHTHACWAGSRIDEWTRRLAGESYLDILASGGGILSTVRAVREASEEDLTRHLVDRLWRRLDLGTTAVEVKGGYGLSLEAELKMLRAIRAVGPSWPGSIVPTALLGHALEPNDPGFVDRTITHTLPEVSKAFPGVTVDAYCEKGAWSLEDTVRLFESAKSLGHPLRVHADQFNSLGMTREAVRLGALSVDHLEASTHADLDLLASSDTFATLLPMCGMHAGRAGLSGPSFADGRRLIDAGAKLAIASNDNPGSAPCLSMQETMRAAVRWCGLSCSEAITAATANPAALLGLKRLGRIRPGNFADLVLLRHTDERELLYELGGDSVEMTVCRGRML
jgi:imidazolonepropionase